MKTLLKPAKMTSFPSSPFTANTALLAFKQRWSDEQSGCDPQKLIARAGISTNVARASMTVTNYKTSLTT